jgi:ribose transport system substrate-binding protein
MRRIALVLAVLALVAGMAAGQAAKFAWYIPAPHPYFETVRVGVEAFEKEYKIPVRKQVGPDWNMDSENTGVLALVAEGYLYLSVYPIDVSAANGLYDEVVGQKGKVVNFGASTMEPTPASFAVRTDVKDAAMVAAEFVIGKMAKKGTLVDVLEVLEDPNTRLRKEGIEQVAKKYPGIKIVEVAGINSEQQAVEKIEGAIAGAGGYVEGIICTGYVPTVALSKILTDYSAKNKKVIQGVGIDTDPVTLKAIEEGYLAGTISQNPFGTDTSRCWPSVHVRGLEGPRRAYNINAGIVMVTGRTSRPLRRT